MKFFFFPAICILLFSGCPYNPVQPLVVDKTIVPNKGSIFNFRDMPLDSNGTEIVDSVYNSKDSIIETGLSLLGKTNVMHILYMNMKNGTVADRFYNFEANGDISFFIPLPISKWITFAFHEWNVIEIIKLFDTTELTSHSVAFDTLRSFGPGPKGFDTIISKTLDAADFTELVSFVNTTDGIISKSTTKSQWELVPTVGYFTIMGYFSRIGIPPYDKFQPVYRNDFTRVLTSFTLK